MNSQLERIFMKVQKPGRYTGGELNSVVKDPAAMDFRFAFCFPDLYEVGMSHLGMKILYSLYNREENMWCERVFAPDTDMEAMMRVSCEVTEQYNTGRKPWKRLLQMFLRLLAPLL